MVNNPIKLTILSLWQTLTKLTVLQVALCVSLALHGVVLSPQVADLINDLLPPPPKPHNSGLAVVLVNRNTSTQKPKDPKDIQALAQVDLDGGGNTEENRRLSSPLPPTAYQQTGEFDNLRLQQQKQELEAEQRRLLAASKATQRKLLDAEKQERKDSPKTTPDGGVDLVESSKALARNIAAVDQRIEDFNQRPRKSFVGIRTRSIAEAQYIEDWRIKVQKIGNLNFPAGHYGSLIVTVVLDRHGAITELEIDKSSGDPVLDETAKRILYMGAPYAPFPPGFLRDMSKRDKTHLSITRTFSFTNQGQGKGSTSISQN